ncbi:MAG: glycosyltransferase [Candidatus Aenigmarchaeota archaeon]|nr:glycosyltransferase [Candidatus Aenigmarchaeota archaeon]
MIYEIVLIFLFTFLFLLNLSWIFIFFKKTEKKYKDFQPNVSVIIPAHNEQDSIKETIQSVLDSDYKGKIEVIVVNDGSTDKTAEIVRSMKNSKIRLLHTNHVGKARALNYGVSKAKYEYILFLDADSSLEKQTIKEIIKPLQDKSIASSSGAVRAKLTKNPLTWFQDFDYIVSSGWRYLSSKIGAVSVLPGFFAIKKSVFLKVNGFNADTLTEDFEITLRLAKAGYKAVANPDAVMFTTTPSTLRSLLKQRIRWGRGTLQVLRKHKDIFASKKSGPLGYYTLPTHLFWYVFSFLYLPSVLYWFFSGFYTYFISTGNVFSQESFLYIFRWLCSYGMFELLYRVSVGIYPLTALLAITILNYFATVFYNILLFFRLGRIKLVHLFVYLFAFPYYFFITFAQFLTVLIELFNVVTKRNASNVWSK